MDSNQDNLTPLPQDRSRRGRPSKAEHAIDELTEATITHSRSAGYTWDYIGDLHGMAGATVRAKARRLGLLPPDPSHWSNKDNPVELWVYPAGCGTYKKGLSFRTLGSEAEARDLLAIDLQDNGWGVRTEVPVGRGRVDILARRDDVVMFIEVKKGKGGAVGCAGAAGQVLFYAEPYPNVCPAIAVPANIARDKRLLSMCNRIGVKVLSIKEGTNAIR